MRWGWWQRRQRPGRWRRIAILKADRREKALSALEGLPHGAVSFGSGRFRCSLVESFDGAPSPMAGPRASVSGRAWPRRPNRLPLAKRLTKLPLPFMRVDSFFCHRAALGSCVA